LSVNFAINYIYYNKIFFIFDMKLIIIIIVVLNIFQIYAKPTHFTIQETQNLHGKFLIITNYHNNNLYAFIILFSIIIH